MSREYVTTVAWERRGSQIYTEEGDAGPGTAEFIADLHPLPNAVDLAQQIVDAHNRNAGYPDQPD